MCDMSPVRPGMRIKIIGPATDGDKSRIGQIGSVLYHGADYACMVFGYGIERAGHGARLTGGIYPIASLAVWQGEVK